MNARSLAAELAADLRAGQTNGAMLRLIRQFVMDAKRGDVAEMIRDRPEPVGDARWDALIAGVVEDVARRAQASTPGWTREPSRYLDEWWFVSDVSRLHPQILTETPAALANHGVYLSRRALVNV